MGEALVDRLVGVLQVDVFADDTDLDAVARVDDAIDHVAPFEQVGIGSDETEPGADDVVEVLVVQVQWGPVDRAHHVEEGDHRLGTHVAEHRDLFPHILVDGVLGAAENHVGGDPDFTQLRDALLGRFGLQLFGRLDVGDEGRVDEGDILMADLVLELAQGLEEGQALDVTGRAADFGDDHVHVVAFGNFVDAALDHVGDVGDDLHGRAEVDPFALVFDHGLVDLAACDVVEAGKTAAREALVVPQIEVGLGAIVEDIDLAVLEGAHRAGIDIQIRVEFLHEDAQPASLQQGPESRCREPLTE